MSFQATVPMRSIMPTPNPAGNILHLSGWPRPDARSGAVYIVDHDPAVRDALKVTLAASGLDALTYRSGGDFLSMLPILREGCLLVEFDLVDMTAAGLVTQLNQKQIDLPVIIMSARLRMPALGQPRPAGIVGILQKPFGQDALLTCLRRAMGKVVDVSKTP